MSDLHQKKLDLLMAIAETVETEIDCEQFLDRVAGYLEHLEADVQPDRELLEVASHLRNCPECREEFEALLDHLRSE